MERQLQERWLGHLWVWVLACLLCLGRVLGIFLQDRSSRNQTQLIEQVDHQNQWHEVEELQENRLLSEFKP